MRLTDKQKQYLRMLDAGPRSTKNIVDGMGVSRAGWPLASPDQIRSAMRRLEDRELVRRMYHPTDKTPEIRWELTKTGREAIEEVVEV